MFASGLIISSTLIFFSIWLQRSEKLGWPNETFQDSDDEKYREQRRRSRRRVNALFFICGVLILIATFATPGNRFWWMTGWMSAMVTLLTILLLAGLDAYRTVRHFRRKINDTRRS